MILYVLLISQHNSVNIISSQHASTYSGFPTEMASLLKSFIDGGLTSALLNNRDIWSLSPAFMHAEHLPYDQHYPHAA